MNETVKVRHIGTHERRKDTMTGTGTVWSGYGDIKPVPAKDWETLKRYPDLWELVTEDVPAEAPPQAAVAAAAEKFAAATTAPAKKGLGLKR